MTAVYELNKEKMPNLDKFADSTNTFLRDIAHKAQKWVMSDRQVWAANNAYDKILNPPKTISLSAEDRESLVHIISSYCPSTNYYHSQDFLDDMRYKLEDNSPLTDKQYSALIKKMEYYKKSILNKIFGKKK